MIATMTGSKSSQSTWRSLASHSTAWSLVVIMVLVREEVDFRASSVACESMTREVSHRSRNSSRSLKLVVALLPMTMPQFAMQQMGSGYHGIETNLQLSTSNSVAECSISENDQMFGSNLKTRSFCKSRQRPLA